VGQQGSASKDALALERLSDARHRLQCQPPLVLFDSGYPAKKLLQRLRLSLEACQGGYTRSWKAKLSTQEGAQTHHSAVCRVAYLMVEREL
jgi:hypothetical protein